MKTQWHATLTAFFVIIFIAGSLSCLAQAQQSIEERIAALDKVLQLTDEQKNQIQKIFSDREEARRSRSGGQTRPEGQMRRPGGMRFGMNFMSRADTAIEEALTPEQVTKYREFRRNSAIDTRIETLDTQLKLNNDQKTKIRAILIEESSKTEKIYADMPEDREARRELFQKFSDIREETNSALMKVLTGDQAKTYQDILEKQRETMRQRRE